MNNNFIKEDTIIVDDDLSVVDLKKDLTNSNLLITRSSFDCNFDISDCCSLIDVKIGIKGKNNRLIIENNTELLNCNIYIKGDNNRIYIGENCKLKGTYLMCCDDGNSITINDFTTVNGEFWGDVVMHTMEETKIELGKDCMLSGNIVLRTTDGHSIIDEKGTRLNVPKDIKIADHVWIGMNSMILKGTHLGKGCIVGANSVVTHSFSEYTILGGNPARKINTNENYDWKRKRGFDFCAADYRNDAK